MAELAFRREASADLLNIHLQGAVQFGKQGADAYQNGLRTAVLRLADFPLLGPVYPGLRSPIRFLTYRSHHIIYEYDGTTVWVVRILHHAMDAGRHL